MWGSFTLHQQSKSSSWRELFGAGKLLETFGPILAGTMVPIYLDSLVWRLWPSVELSLLTLTKKFGDKKLLNYKTLCPGYTIRLSNTILVFEPCGFLGP